MDLTNRLRNAFNATRKKSNLLLRLGVCSSLLGLAGCESLQVFPDGPPQVDAFLFGAMMNANAANQIKAGNMVAAQRSSGVADLSNAYGHSQILSNQRNGNNYVQNQTPQNTDNFVVGLSWSDINRNGYIEGDEIRDTFTRTINPERVYLSATAHNFSNKPMPVTIKVFIVEPENENLIIKQVVLEKKHVISPDRTLHCPLILFPPINNQVQRYMGKIIKDEGVTATTYFEIERN